jgi:sorbitol/mannitol transport system permease protein
LWAGILIALLIDQPIWGQGPVRILVISPFFIMPPVAALIWKNMFMNPTNGLFASAAKAIGLSPFDFLGQATARVHRDHRGLAVAALRHADPPDRSAKPVERAAGGRRDGRGARRSSGSGTSCCPTWRAHHRGGADPDDLPARILVEILVTTNGGPGSQSTTLTFLVYKEALLDYECGRRRSGRGRGRHPSATSSPSS